MLAVVCVGFECWVDEVGESSGDAQRRRARLVLSSSPTRRIGSMRNFAPSISPTPSSGDASLLAFCRRALVAMVRVVGETMARVAGRRARMR